MPEVEQRTQLGGRHEFRVLRDISGDEYWGPWMTAPEGGLAASEIASLAEPARACMRQLKLLDRRVVLALPSLEEAPFVTGLTCVQLSGIRCVLVLVKLYPPLSTVLWGSRSNKRRRETEYSSTVY